MEIEVWSVGKQARQLDAALRGLAQIRERVNDMAERDWADVGLVVDDVISEVNEIADGRWMTAQPQPASASQVRRHEAQKAALPREQWAEPKAAPGESCRTCDGSGTLTVPDSDGESASEQPCPDPVHDGDDWFEVGDADAGTEPKPEPAAVQWTEAELAAALDSFYAWFTVTGGGARVQGQLLGADADDFARALHAGLESGRAHRR